MKNLEEVLPKEIFQRAHRSYFVNVTHIRSVLRQNGKQKGVFLELGNGASLRLGNAYIRNFRN